MNLWVSSIDKAINDALNNIQNQSTHNNSSSFNVSSSNEMNLDENESNSELFDLQESYSSSFNNDVNNSNQNGSYSHNSSSNNLMIANNNNSFKNIRDLNFNCSSNSLGKSLISDGKQSNIENKKNLLLSVNGNQNCCDCGASSPSWVNINITDFMVYSPYSPLSPYLELK